MTGWPPVQPETPRPRSPIQDVAALVAVIVALFSVVAQSRENPRLAVGVVLVAVLVGVLPYLWPAISFVRDGRTRARRNSLARSYYTEFLQFTRRLYELIKSGNSSNLRHIIFSFSGHEDEKLAQVCPPDYLKDFYPLFLGRLEHTPPKTEADLCTLVREFSTYVASYNDQYILEPFRRMRAQRWKQFDSVARAQAQGGQKDVPVSVPWLETLPEHQRQQAERQIEAFREAWVKYLDDLIVFLGKLNDSLGGNNLPTWFEKPQKL